MRFESPWTLLLLVLIPALGWLRARRAGSPATLRFSWTGHAVLSGRSLRQRLGFVPSLLRVLALVLLVIALARPQQGLEQVREVNQGIAIEMVLDRSSSMGQEMEFEGATLNRLDVVKNVFERFVQGDGGKLRGRPSDLVGMVSFARYAETVCPLTLAHDALPRFLETVRLARPRTEEDGTSIGDAVALAAARLKTVEKTLEKQAPDRADRYEIKSKVIILLTDGDQTSGKREPLEGAKIAEQWGIRIYAIAVGGSGYATVNTFLGPQRIPVGSNVDFNTLEQIAESTGGRAYKAEDAAALQRVYAEIDELEESEIESVRYVDYRELYLPWALAAFVLVGLELVLSQTVYRRVP